MWVDFERSTGVKVKDPTMIVAVSTSMPQYKALYSQAREMSEYLLGKLAFEEVATVHCSAFPPEVIVKEDGTASLPACHVYLTRGKGDILLFAGDTSPMDDQHEFAEILLKYAEDMGVKELYSVGARWTDNPLSPEQDPEPVGFSTDKAGVAKLKKHRVKIVPEEPAPFFSSMVVGMAGERGIRGYKIAVDHGEPSTHNRSVRKLLEALSELVGFEIPLDELKSKAPPSARPPQVGDSSIYH
ncbi:MAG: PAC2 family protein [Thaumarchaeota archaeon]|nr:PAC2 family protein [Nitrososphaerota archaeon]